MSRQGVASNLCNCVWSFIIENKGCDQLRPAHLQQPLRSQRHQQLYQRQHLSHCQCQHLSHCQREHLQREHLQLEHLQPEHLQRQPKRLAITSTSRIGGTSPSAIAMVTSPTGAPANQTLGRREHREEGNGRVPRQME